MTLLLRWLAPYAFKGIMLAGVLASLYFYILHVEDATRSDQKRLDAAAVQVATAKADLLAAQMARIKEAAQAQGTREANNAMLPALSAANARADAYVASLRSLTAQGRTGSANVPTSASAADVADSADRLAKLDADIHRCTVIATRLLNGQDWAEKALIAPRTP